MRTLTVLLLFAIGLLGFQTALAQESSTPTQPSPIPVRIGYLTDLTGKLMPNEIQGLETYLKQAQQQTGTTIDILVVNSTQPTEIVAYTHQVADAWGLKPDQDKWILIVVALTDGHINIADSEAMRKILPDAALSQVINEQITPAFEKGQLSLGLANGAQAIVQRLVLAVPQDHGTPGSSADDAARLRAELMLFGLLGLIVAALIIFVVKPF